MKILNFLFLLALCMLLVTSEEVAKKKSSMDNLAPPLQLDSSCRVVECYRNMLNVSNNCKKNEHLHSFKKCEKKFYREEVCCSGKKK